MAVRLLSAAGDTGLDRFVVVPSPSWPRSFSPHARPVLSDFLMARLWPPPQAIAFTARPPMAGVGTGRFVVVPSPSWPKSLRPHARTVSSERIARLWFQPAAMAFTVAPPRLTATGGLLQAKLVAQMSALAVPSSP